jgi:glycosyltransferase involved in cell wall biosynthesis
MPRVVFFFRGGRADLLDRVERGTGPDEFLYGMNHFTALGFETSFAEAAVGDGEALRRVLRPFETAISMFLGCGFSLANPWIHWRTLQEADVIVSTTDGNTLPLLALKSLGKLRCPVVAVTQGLFEMTERLGSKPWATLAVSRVADFMRQADRVAVLGEGDREGFCRVFGSEFSERVVDVQFGVDAQFWSPGPVAQRGPVLSVGSDVLRDYETLLEAAGDLPLRIVTRLPVTARNASTLVNGHVDEGGLRQLYREAPCVVVPVKDQERDSGHSVTLQAMACGRPVILSDTRGLWDRDHLAHGENCYLVPPHDSIALRAMMERVLAAPDEAERIGANARRLVESRYTSRHFAEHLARAVRAALGKTI